MEDIKKAIEEEYLEYLHGTTDEKEFLNNNDLLPFKDAVKACEITASFILSKWEESTRWRKVEEELPEDNITVLLEIEYDGITDCSTGHFYDKGKKYHLDSELYKDAIITCWKPIH